MKTFYAHIKKNKEVVLYNSKAEVINALLPRWRDPYEVREVCVIFDKWPSHSDIFWSENELAVYNSMYWILHDDDRIIAQAVKPDFSFWDDICKNYGLQMTSIDMLQKFDMIYPEW